MKIDLHVHSKYSTDNDADPEETILRAVEIGLQGICFTEHYSYAASEPIETLAGKYRDRILIFRGVELSAREGHCLIFGVNTDTLGISNAPVSEIVPLVNSRGGVVIPSHPYRTINSMGDLVLKTPGLCAVEGYNGCNMHGFNQRAIEAAAALGLPWTGGSDSHQSRDVGSCFTEFEDRVTRQSFMSLLKGGRFRGVDNRKISKLDITW